MKPKNSINLGQENTDRSETERKYDAMMSEVKRVKELRADLKEEFTTDGLYTYLDVLDKYKINLDAQKVTSKELGRNILEYYKKPYTESWGGKNKKLSV